MDDMCENFQDYNRDITHPASKLQHPITTRAPISASAPHSPPLLPLPLRLPRRPHLPLQPIQIPKPKLHPPPPPPPPRLLPRPHRRPVLNPLPIRDAHVLSTSSGLARSDDGPGGRLGGGPCLSGGGWRWSLRTDGAGGRLSGGPCCRSGR